jgi:hypothetical protein
VVLMQTPDSISPRERLIASHSRTVSRLTRARIPLYGLPPRWPGARSSGSTSFELGVERRRDGRLDAQEHATVELVHDPDPSRPGGQLVVESSNHLHAVGAEPLGAALAEFVDRVVRKGHPAPSSAEPDLFALTVLLDGRETAFAAAQRGDLWVARWQGYEVTVTIKAAAWPLDEQLELCRVTDLTPYLDGRRRRLEERSGYRLG